MGMVTGIWVAAVVAIITDGAEAVVIIMDGPAAGTADGINCYIEAENQPRPIRLSTCYRARTDPPRPPRPRTRQPSPTGIARSSARTLVLPGSNSAPPAAP